MIDVEGMAAFVAVAETTSFSRAADQLGVAQSVVSKRLKRLEDQIGARLFDRTVRSRIVLTSVGENYLPEVRATLFQLSKAERIGRNLARGESGPIRIGYIFSAAMNGTLHAVLSAIGASLPEMAVDVQMMETPEQLSALDDGRLDVALVRPRSAYPRGCTATLVHREHLVLGHSTGHPLAALSELDPSSLRDQRFIIPQFREKVGLVENLQALAKAGRFAMPDAMKTFDFVTATALAAAGLGVVLAPASIAGLALDGLKWRKIKKFCDPIETFLVQRHDAPRKAIEIATLSLPELGRDRSHSRAR